MKIITLGNGFAVTKKGKIIMITENIEDAKKIVVLSKNTKKLLKSIK